MADSNIKVKEQAIEKVDADGDFSVKIHIESNSEDPATPPTVKIAKVRQPEARQDSQVANVDATIIIISTGSGGNLAEKFYNQAVSPVLEALYPASHTSFHIHRTQSESSILELTHDVIFPKVNNGHRLRIILLSGDGGIIDLINGLLAQESGANYLPPQVVLLPLGTANALYHSISAGQDHTWGLGALVSEQSHSCPLPLFTASFSPGSRLLVNEGNSEKELPKDAESGRLTLHGAVVCSWGMHASLVADSDTTEYRKFGIDRFKMAAKDALYPADGSQPHVYKASVSILKGETWRRLDSGEHMYVLATMVSNLEETFTISPASKPLDGSLHLVHFGPTNGDDAMRIMGLAYQGGKHVDDAAVVYEAIDGLRIQFEGREEDPKWRRICVDGKIVKVEKDGWVELRKLSKHVLNVAITEP
jgi:diacylglycerol kinase family enzyme